MIFGLLFLFGHYGDVPLSTLDDPLLIAILAVTCVGIPVLGNFRPDLISFLPSMRYYAGNWATSQWLFRKEQRRRGEARPRDRQVGADRHRAAGQVLRRRSWSSVLLYKGLAFRSMHSHGRALNGLVRARGRRRRGLRRARGRAGRRRRARLQLRRRPLPRRAAAGAVQERCGFEPGELRVVTLESQPAHVPRQRYRIFDAADGPGRGGLGQRRRHGRAPALAGRAAVPRRIRSPSTTRSRPPAA